MIWGRTTNGKPCAFDARPTQVFLKEPIQLPDGTLVEAVSGHVTHYATCPNAGQFRKGSEG